MQKIKASNISASDYARMEWVVDLEPGMTVKDLLQAEFWAHVASNFQKWHRVEARAHDGSFMVELVVLACERLWAKVAVLAVHEFESAKAKDLPPVPEGFDVKWRGKCKWSVIRLSDKQVLFENGDSRLAASRWLEDYNAKITA